MYSKTKKEMGENPNQTNVVNNVPEAPCGASSVRAADELAPSWLLSESAIFSCRRASAAPRLPRPEPRRLKRGKREV